VQPDRLQIGQNGSLGAACKKDLKLGLPDFSWCNIPKRGKHTKWPQNTPKCHKIYPMAIKYTIIFHWKNLRRKMVKNNYHYIDPRTKPVTKSIRQSWATPTRGVTLISPRWMGKWTL
jgi:hypothetical protein